MMRSRPASTMQKTYDECYLQCSTAVFFEGQNNENEALRSWKAALEQIHMHNATKLPYGWSPRTEMERSLWNALKEMEAQCKERVDLLTALKESRRQAEQDSYQLGLGNSSRTSFNTSQTSLHQPSQPFQPWLEGDRRSSAQHLDLPSVQPSLPSRKHSSDSIQQISSRVASTTLSSPPILPVPKEKGSRTPSPDARKPMRMTLRKEGASRTPRTSSGASKKPATMNAASLAWSTTQPEKTAAPKPRGDPTIEARLSAQAARRSLDAPIITRPSAERSTSMVHMPDPAEYTSRPSPLSQDSTQTFRASTGTHSNKPSTSSTEYEPEKNLPQLPSSNPATSRRPPPPPPPHRIQPAELKYRKEQFGTAQKVVPSYADHVLKKAYAQPDPQPQTPAPPLAPSSVHRKPVPPSPITSLAKGRPPASSSRQKSQDNLTKPVRSKDNLSRPSRTRDSGTITPPSTDDSDADPDPSAEPEKTDFELRSEALIANPPRGVDLASAKSILNEIIIKGDEVYWEDVAGLTEAKKALKEAVVYPFLRPDLFMGLREPARGMLLFGPPGTGKTMLARAVATESKSTFFAISASSLTSKWHGESEKLVRALFAMAKALAPSIIFVDEIDSLLSSRGGSTENEASRRAKTEFLIQWSDLQRAAAGKETGIGDASRVLVLAATNCPWDIDDAARRRFVRRQYIPLPEDETREVQIRSLLKSQKHVLDDRDVRRLVGLTDGYSGSDLTSLCKDAAMQPLRNLGEALLTTPVDQIRPMTLADFKASLESIRPSVSQKGLEEYEKWAAEFGERGG